MIEVSKGTVFSYVGKDPQTMICLKNLPAWDSGIVYITEKEAKELIIDLEKTIKQKNPIIFD